MNSAEKIAKLRKKKQLVIKILAPSDIAGPNGANMWGDHWVKWELSRAFKSLGMLVTVSPFTKVTPDVVIHQYGGTISYLYGTAVPKTGLPEEPYKIAWVYSHPEQVTSTSLRIYDKIFCCSISLTKHLQDLGYSNAQVMLGATAKKPVSVPNQYDIVFVGNNRGPYGREGRKIIDDLKSLGTLPYRIGIWGNNWQGHVPDSWYGGRYIPYPQLDKLYASATVCLQDHRPEMRTTGIVSVKIFDILASGGFVISDQNIGLKGIFKGAVPEYRDAAHLRSLLDFYISDPYRRVARMLQGKAIALSCPWTKRAALFIEELQGGS